MILSHRLTDKTVSKIAIASNGTLFRGAWLLLTVLLVFGLGFRTEARAETCTPSIILKGNNTTGPITVAVGAPIAWSYEALCTDRVEFFVRTRSTVGNCGMSALIWAGWKGSETTSAKTFTAENIGACQAGGEWEVAAMAIKGTVASTTSVVNVNVPPSGTTTATPGTGTTATYTLGGKATVRDRVNGSSNDRLFQHIVSDEPSMANFLYNTARQGVRDWNAKNGYTYSDPIGLLNELSGRFASGGDVGINTFVTRVTGATTSPTTLNLTTTEDWLWQLTTNPTSGCSRTAVLFGINTRTDRPVTITNQTMTASACSSDHPIATEPALIAERKRLMDAGIPLTTAKFDTTQGASVMHAVPEDAPLPNRQAALGHNN